MPKNHDPYVWSFLKDGTGAAKKAPKNILTKNDYYTVGKSRGERDLSVETKLSTIESAFNSIRKHVLKKGKQPNDVQRQTIFLFTAAMHARNPRQIDHMTGEWDRVHNKMSKLQSDMENVPLKDLNRANTPGNLASVNSSTANIDDVEEYLKEPISSFMVPATMAEYKCMIAIEMNMTFLRPMPGSEQRFITSDNPAVWNDPELMKRPSMYQVLGLAYESIEITLPISPNLSILLNRKGHEGYQTVSDSVIDQQNRRTRHHAINNIITHKDYFNPKWI